MWRFGVVSQKVCMKKRMRGVLPSEESLLVLLDRIGMSRKSYELQRKSVRKGGEILWVGVSRNSVNARKYSVT